jgi:dipeptidyl-peptidase-3
VKGCLPAVMLATLALCLVVPSPSSAAAEAPLVLDEFLFSPPAQLDENLARLAARVEEGADAATQALYGIQLLAKGDHATARQHCSEALSRGLLFEPVYCMSMVAFAEGNLKQAAELAQEAIRLRPRSVAAYVVLANVRRTLKDKEGMVRAVEMGVASMPDRAAFWEWELARMFESLGDLDGALQCIGVLSRITAQDPKVFTQAGDWLRQKGRLAEAVQMYRFALSKASWYQPAAVALMETFREDQRWADIHRVAPELKANPQLAPIVDTLSAFEAEANEKLLEAELSSIESRTSIPLDALHEFERVEPSVATAILVEVAEAAVRFGSPLRSLEFLRKAHGLDPTNAEVMLIMGEVLLQAGRLELATSFIRDGVTLDPGPESFVLAARLATALEKPDECVDYLDKALEIRPDYTEALLLAVQCHRMVRQSGKELDRLLEAYRVDPENAAVLGELSRYYLHTKNGRETAASYLQKLYSLKPQDYRVCRKLADLHGEADRPREALAVLAACYESVPPYLGEMRAEVEAQARKAAGQMRDEERILAGLDRLCQAGAEGACADVAELRRSEQRRRALTRADYRLRARKPLVGELERLGANGEDFLILGLEAPGFDDLSRDEKIFLFYLSRAAIAGDELLYVQNHRHALQVKRLLETLFTFRRHLPKSTAEAVHDYLKYVWVNHGNYDHRSGMKFVPRKLTKEALLEAMELLVTRGETLDFIPGKGPAEKFAYLERTIFDATFEPHLTVSGKGMDVVAESAVNHYDPGITDALVAKLPRKVRNALNVRLGLVGGKVVPEYYRTEGLGGSYLKRIVHFLRAALPYSGSSEQRRSLEALILFYESGEEAAFRDHSVEWLKTRGNTDYINGFVEQLKDPRGVIGNFEGMAAFVSDARLVERLADQAEYFEKGMPWPEQFKREQVARPVSNVATLLVGTGDMGPVPWAGYNLPNYDDIRAKVGSKNVIFLNLMTARSEPEQEAALKEFYLPEYQPLVRQWGELATNWNVYMHEIIGHGSGKPDPGLKDEPRNLIGRSFSALEEARADLVALYFIADPMLVEIGAIPKGRQDEVVLASYAKYFQGFLTLYRRFHGGDIKEAHWKGRQLILAYLLNGGEGGEGDYGIKLVEEGGNYFLRIEDSV